MSLRQWFIKFAEKEKKNFFELPLFFFFYLLSLLYRAVIFIRNRLYDKRRLPLFVSSKKIISVGNISWSGSGKTPLSLYLYKGLSPQYRIAILRRGYGTDEERMYNEAGIPVFSSPHRVKPLVQQEENFDIFILDDGFQYRKLHRDLNIVVMGARELQRSHYHLLPASFFREPPASLQRADILIINYKNQLREPLKIKALLYSHFPHLKVYFATYTVVGMLRGDGSQLTPDYFKTNPFAAFAAIGYPEGFFATLKTLGLEPRRKIVFPDHHRLTNKEFVRLEEALLSEGISDLIITRKDRYHIPKGESKLNTVIMDVELSIEDEEGFWEVIRRTLTVSHHTNESRILKQ